MHRRRSFRVLVAMALGLVLVAFSTGALARKSVNEERAKIRGQSTEALARLYAAQPSARAAVASAAGYATFSNWGLKLGIAGGGRGRGLAVTRNNARPPVFMRFVEIEAGIGLGIKKFDLIFVFETQQAMNNFVNRGWEAGAQATAAASMGDRGRAYAGAMSVSPGVWVYQVTESGLAAELTISGTKYYKDDDLN